MYDHSRHCLTVLVTTWLCSRTRYQVSQRPKGSLCWPIGKFVKN